MLAIFSWASVQAQSRTGEEVPPVPARVTFHLPERAGETLAQFPAYSPSGLRNFRDRNFQDEIHVWIDKTSAARTS